MIKAFLKQILDMGSVILLLLYAHYTIDNKKPLINGTLRYIAIVDTISKSLCTMVAVIHSTHFNVTLSCFS